MSGRTRVLRALAAISLIASPFLAVAGLDVVPATAAPVADPTDAPTAPGGGADLGDVGAFVAPMAPVNVTAEALNGSARVSFALPDGSDAATSFEVTPSVGGAPTSGATSPIVVPGLTNGVAVSFTVTATNDSGTSAPSAASNEVTPTAAPTTMPVFTAPPASSVVSGVVHITAASFAPRVRFTVAGVDLGPPVAVSLGSVAIDWPSWGFANGLVPILGYDCNTASLETCSSTPGSLGVALENATPVVTSPTAGQLTSSTVPLRATAPGGAVSLEIDGVRKALDATVPYAQTASLAGLADGDHVARAVSCDATGTRCDGLVSADVTFQVKSLHPTIASVVPSRFSPNDDGVKDTATVDLVLPDPQSATWRVLNDADETVRGPISLGALTTGSHPFSWNGKSTAGTRVPDGTYRIVIATTTQETGVTIRGSVETTVVVDATAPSITNVTGSGGTFYPSGGGSPAKFTAGATLAERVMLTMTVRKPSGGLVRQPFGTRGPGAATIQWTGKNTHDQFAASGTYNWWLKATDDAGNSRTVGKFTATMVRYASRTAIITLGGGAYSSLGASDSSCSYISRADSDFATGLWLLNECGGATPKFVQANYAVTVPAALRYDSVTVATAGFTINPPTEIYALVIKPNGVATPQGSATARTSNGWTSFPAHPAAGHVNQAGRLKFAIGVSNAFGTPSDFDINSVQVKVTYTVIA